MIEKVLDLYKTIDAATADFCQSTGLHCKSGCGACCTKPDIETTVCELLPMAQWVIDEGRADAVLAAIDNNNPVGQCVLFKPDQAIPGNGQCGAYPYRPGICRLFAFAAKRDKHQQPKLVTCKIIKEYFPDDVQKAQHHLDQHLPAPILNDHTMRIMTIDPKDGSTLLPINQALAQAIEGLLLKKRFM